MWDTEQGEDQAQDQQPKKKWADTAPLKALPSAILEIWCWPIPLVVCPTKAMPLFSLI